MNRYRLLTILMLLIVGPAGYPICAQAHKVTVFAWVEGDVIHTESQFSGGGKVREGRIEVHDGSGRRLLSGITDAQGRFSFAIPRQGDSKPGDLKVILTAGAGHGNEWVVRAEELGGGATGNGAERIAPASGALAEAQNGRPDTPLLDAARIEQIVEASMERKLAPLRRQLADQTWGLRDVVGGIGYILGLMGLAAWLHYRRQTGAKP